MNELHGGLALPAFLLTLGVSLAAAWLLLSMGRRGWAMDIPNERSLHQRPIPRTGGLAIAAGMAVGWWWTGSLELLIPIGLASALLAVSLLDDLRGLSVGLRLLAHAAAALAFVWLVGLQSPPWAVPLWVLAVVWATNLFNFMDGSDGLAGGMACFGFGGYALAAWLSGDLALALACVVVVAAALGFLAFNFHPARLFMGDAGSIPLGFLAATIGLLGWQRGSWSLFLPVVAFSPFVVDASVTLIKRGLRGDRVWRAHREHYYQRLLRLGLGHHGVAWLEYALMLMAGGLALATQWSPTLAWPIMCGWFAALALAMAWIDHAWAQADRVA